MSHYLSKYFSLEGRVALVTGASRGIGRAVAVAFAGAGAEVCVHFNKNAGAAGETLAEIEKAGGKAWTAGADLTKPNEVRALAEKVKARWGRFDILVNNAGDLVKRSPVENASDELIDQVMRINVHSTLYTIRECLPLLKLGTQPSILNLSSVAAHHGGGNGALIYAAAKGAIHTLTRGLAKELAPQIRVNALAPGVIMTDFHRVHTKEDALKAMAAATPLKRLGEADDCAAAAIYLSAPGASFITGEIIEINGGIWLA